jgi:hypothetical protein
MELGELAAEDIEVELPLAVPVRRDVAAGRRVTGGEREKSEARNCRADQDSTTLPFSSTMTRLPMRLMSSRS